MKKTIIFLVTAAIAVSLASCKDVSETRYKLSADKDQLIFESQGSDIQTVTVTAENVDWKISQSNTWIHTEKRGNAVNVSVDDYDNDKQKREGHFIISSGINEAPDITVTVTQNPKSAVIFKAAPTLLEFKKAGNEPKTVTVTAQNLTWNVKPADVNATWVHLVKKDNAVEVTVDDNEDSEPRETKFVIAADNGEAADIEVTVTQAKHEGTTVFYTAVNGKHNGDHYGNGLENFTVQFESLYDPASNTSYPEGYVVVLDFFSATPPDLMNPDIAAGDYTISNTDGEFVVRVSSSTVIVFEEGYEVSRREPQSGTVKVEKDGDNYRFEFDMMTEDLFYGGHYPLKGVYEGPIEITHQFLSNLEDDVQLPELIGGYIDFWGEYNYGVQSNYWAAKVWSEGITCDENNNLSGNGQYIDLEFYTALDESTTVLPSGTYPLAMSMEAGTSQRGYVDFLILGSWYLEMIEDRIQMEGSKLAPMSSGTVTVSYDKGIYTIIIDAIDDLGHKITGSYTGPLKYKNQME